MNVLILAAGYATRLYPLTLNKAKTADKAYAAMNASIKQ